MRENSYFSELEWLETGLQCDAYLLADLGPSMSEETKKMIEGKVFENAVQIEKRDRLFFSIKDKHLYKLLDYRYRKGLRCKEIALLMQCPVKEVYRDLAKARKEVRKLLDAEEQQAPDEPRRPGRPRMKTETEGCA